MSWNRKPLQKPLPSSTPVKPYPSGYKGSVAKFVGKSVLPGASVKPFPGSAGKFQKPIPTKGFAKDAAQPQPGTVGATITGPPHAMELKARRRLLREEDVRKFMAHFTSKIAEAKKKCGEKQVCFSDLDISHSKLSEEQFATIFNTLSESDVRVDRLRLFLTPSVNDDVVCNVLCGWFRELATPPIEVHLSDCRISSSGFLALMDAIEGNDAFPAVSTSSKTPGPMYLRLEQNYIDEADIQEKIDSGVIVKLSKSDLGTQKYPESVKVKLVFMNDRCAQKKGSPPPLGAASAASQPSPPLPAGKPPQAAKSMQELKAAATPTIDLTRERSRSPKRPTAPTSGSRSLPSPWEEYLSGVWKIPCYFNPQTGEKVWDKPTS